MKTTQSDLVMPILSAGRHRTPRQGACFMEFASYLAGERWSDHPACTHPLLAALARNVNDLISDAARPTLVPHIHRVVGLASDDPYLAALIVVRAAGAALPIASMERQRALAVALVNVLGRFDDALLREIAATAFASAPDTERWARTYVSTTRWPREFDLSTAAAVVHTATIGIAQACVDDADARLAALLQTAIDDAESLQPNTTRAPALQRV